LKSLGRIHDEREARRAIEMAMRTFDNVNLDVMYGLPAQTVEEARVDIEAALSFHPPHLSCYHLTIEPNTYFHRFPPKLPNDDATAAMQEAIEARLAEAGYDHYETSAFAKRIQSLDTRHSTLDTSRCAHNLNYWTFGDYLGAGFAAALFEERAGLPLTAILRELENAERRGLIERDHARIAPTPLGRRFLNDLLQLFLREKAAV
jgi:oxygen-independent coproporphyrinogen-3 oxidase